MNSDWKAVCTHCHRSSSWIEDGFACPWCGNRSAKWERWLDAHRPVQWAVAYILIAAMILAAIYLNTAQAGDVKLTIGTVGDRAINLTTIEGNGVNLTIGSLGDDAVNLLEVESEDGLSSLTLGTVGDDNVSVWEWDDEDPD